MERIPFLDLSQLDDGLADALTAGCASVIRSGRVLLGDRLAGFERDWAAACAARHGVGVACGLDAMVLSLQALGIKPGDEVIVPANTYVATWLAVSRIGATPVPVECRADSGNLDATLLDAAATTRTRAVLATHLYGMPADLDPICAWAKPRGLAVVEDAAQAHGATYRGRPIGAHGDAVCWSFYPTKNLGALGDAGAVTTDRADLAERLRCLRNYGQRTRYICDELGANSRLEELHAAMLSAKLAHLPAWNRRRADIAGRYRAAFTARGPRCFAEPADRTSSNHLFPVLVADRDAFRARLEFSGIQTLVHYPVPPHLQPAYAGLGLGRGAFPVSERIADEVVSLPLHPYLSDAQVDRIIAVAQDAS